METLPYISLWVTSDSGTVNLNRPLRSLFSRLRRTSLLPPGLAASGNFWVAAFGGRLTRSRAGQQPPAWPRSPRGLEGKSCELLASSAWLAFGKRITCPREGEGPVAQSPSPPGNTDQPGLSSSSTSLPCLLGPSSHESVSQERKIIQCAFPHSEEQGQECKGTTKRSNTLRGALT